MNIIYYIWTLGGWLVVGGGGVWRGGERSPSSCFYERWGRGRMDLRSGLGHRTEEARGWVGRRSRAHHRSRGGLVGHLRGKTLAQTQNTRPPHSKGGSGPLIAIPFRLPSPPPPPHPNHHGPHQADCPQVHRRQGAPQAAGHQG